MKLHTFLLIGLHDFFFFGYLLTSSYVDIQTPMWFYPTPENHYFNNIETKLPNRYNAFTKMSVIFGKRFLIFFLLKCKSFISKRGHGSLI